MVINVVFIAR